LLEQARAAGVAVDVAHDQVGLHWQDPTDDVRQVTPAPTVGETYRCAVISDTHAGSRYAMRGQLADFVRHAYTEGCREVLHAGDILDGCYRHGVFELTHSGLADQARDAATVLPALPGLTYHAITGNHDGTFSERTGLDVGQAITGAWSALGRSDLTVYGARSAYLRLGGAVIHLWHPKKAGAYALSYLLQKQVERYSALKPQVLIAGHWHVFCHVCVRGVEAIASPCFQGSGSDFAKSLGGSPAIGGLILEWRLTEHGTIRDFALRPRRYYEREAIVEVRNRVDGEIVPPAVSAPVAVPLSSRWGSCSG
jgi:predicted phosphodiesterase